MTIQEYVPLWPICEHWAKQASEHPAGVLAALCEHAAAGQMTPQAFRHRLTNAFYGQRLLSFLPPKLALERWHFDPEAHAAVREIDVSTGELLALCRGLNILPPQDLTAATGRAPWLGSVHRSPVEALGEQSRAVVAAVLAPMRERQAQDDVRRQAENARQVEEAKRIRETIVASNGATGASPTFGAATAHNKVRLNGKGPIPPDDPPIAEAIRPPARHPRTGGRRRPYLAELAKAIVHLNDEDGGEWFAVIPTPQEVDARLTRMAAGNSRIRALMARLPEVPPDKSTPKRRRQALQAGIDEARLIMERRRNRDVIGTQLATR